MNIQQINTLSAQEVKAEMKRAMTREKNHFYLRHRKANGTVSDVEVFSNHIVIDSKKLLYSIIHDVTEQQLAEAEREKLQKQLLHSQKMEIIGQLAGSIAHDFNNMLGVISGHAEMAIEKGFFSSEDIEAIQKAALSSADMTRQLLAFARRQPAVPAILNLNEAIKGMLSMLKRLIGEYITLEWISGDHEFIVKMDPSQLDQILANLAFKACDATGGAGTIVIRTFMQPHDAKACQYDQSGDFSLYYVTLAFTDSGCGIDKKILPHIYEPYYTTKEVGKGTGLGLSTVYVIIKQNNGYLACDSREGEGTTFTIHLPLHGANNEIVERKECVLRVVNEKQTILLVEDQDEILRMCKRVLEMQGYKVLPASMPNEAIQIALECRSPIDLLLTDVVMQEMNGSDLSLTLKSIYPDIKTLFMSEYTADIIASHGVVDDGVNFIRKPFAVKQLIKTTQELLDSDGNRF